MFDVSRCAKKIKEARMAQNMTQMNLADAMEVSYQAVSNWERGNSMPDISKLEQLSNVLQISLDELLGTGTHTATVKTILVSDEDNRGEGVTMEELSEVAALLPPKDMKKCVENATKDKKKINTEALVEMAPFLDEEALEEIVRNVDLDLDTVDELVPFLNKETLKYLIDNMWENGYDTEMVVLIAPFLSDQMLEELAERMVAEGKVEDLEEIYPFLNSNTLKKIAKLLF